MEFFGEDVLLGSQTAQELYQSVKNLPIIDYHCHLSPRELAENAPLGNLGELWLKCDHYKWRAMRLCGVDERYITGEADYEQKFAAYARVLPLMAGSPLYYWSHMELKTVFGIDEPLSEKNAERVFALASGKIAGKRPLDLMQSFKVEYVATTDDPADSLEFHGRRGGALVAPTFRPDKALACDRQYLAATGQAFKADLFDLKTLKRFLTERLDYFVSKGCRIADSGFDSLSAEHISEKAAQSILCDADASQEDKRRFFTHMLCFMAAEYARRGITMQLHFSVTRNINTAAFKLLGADAGFDVFENEINAHVLIGLLNALNNANALPPTVLYSLNAAATPMLCAVSGAFKNVRVGAAWWFNDTLEGIKRHLSQISEYSVIGNNLGMLTDSRSFLSYVRFDFFRRILCDFIGGMTERGEYDGGSAPELVQAICYNNVKEFLKL